MSEESQIVSAIVAHEMANGQIKFAMNGELKSLTFLYYSIGNHIDKILRDEADKLKIKQTPPPESL